MFDKTYVKGSGSTTYVPYEKTVTVTEHRAPTDDSIKIYKEMYEKSLKNIAEVLEIKNSLVEGKVVRFIQEDWTDSEQILVIFKINGQEFRQVHKIPRSYSGSNIKERFIEIFREYLMVEIFRGMTFSQQDYTKLFSKI